MKNMNDSAIILMSIALFLLVLGYSFHQEFVLRNLTTDSGWDTSYDGGSSDSGGGFDSDSSSGTGGELSFDIPSIGVILVVTTILLVLALISIGVKIKKFGFEGFKTTCLPSLIIAFVFDLFILFPAYLMIGIVIIVVGFFLWGILAPNKNKKGKKKEETLELPFSEENEKLKEDCYHIFYQVQMAWMEMDYDSLRRYVTDELYNMYVNQLDTLKLKNQKNIMKDFVLDSIALVDKQEKDGMYTAKVNLKVNFYDYVVDNDTQHVVRGMEHKKVHMTYLLTFVWNENAPSTCPSCNAPLNSGESICAYCGTTIQAVRNDLKLSKKEVLKQE